MVNEPGSCFLVPEGNKSLLSKFSDVVPPSSDKSLILWRYLGLAKLIALLSDKKLHFARADILGDQHEGSITKSMMEAARQQYADRDNLSKIESGFRKKPMKESIFISCWCMEPESEAMWKLYCGDNYGVAITVVYRDIEAFSNSQGLHIAPVKYLDYQIDGFPRDNLLYPFFHKRLAFAHEKEVRIVEWCDDQLPGISVEEYPPPADKKVADEHKKRAEERKVERGTSILLEFDVETLVRTIVVHPYAPEWYFRVIKLVVEKFTPILVEKVKWSSMRTEPLY